MSFFRSRADYVKPWCNAMQNHLTMHICVVGNPSCTYINYGMSPRNMTKVVIHMATSLRECNMLMEDIKHDAKDIRYVVESVIRGKELQDVDKVYHWKVTLRYGGGDA